MSVTDHFRERVAERVSPHICADQLWAEIERAIAEDLTDLARFVCTVAGGRKAYRVAIAGIGDRYVILSSDRSKAITILLPDGVVRRRKPGKFKRLTGQNEACQ